MNKEKESVAMQRPYESRGSLVLEYVKIDDEDVFEGDR